MPHPLGEKFVLRGAQQGWGSPPKKACLENLDRLFWMYRWFEPLSSMRLSAGGPQDETVVEKADP